jgi:hypothetical protein
MEGWASIVQNLLDKYILTIKNLKIAIEGPGKR